MKYILLDKEGRIRCVMRHHRPYEAERIEQILEYDTYAEALTAAKEHGNLDVAEVRVITGVRTSTIQQQHIDYYTD